MHGFPFLVCLLACSAFCKLEDTALRGADSSSVQLCVCNPLYEIYWIINFVRIVPKLFLYVTLSISLIVSDSELVNWWYFVFCPKPE